MMVERWSVCARRSLIVAFVCLVCFDRYVSWVVRVFGCVDVLAEPELRRMACMLETVSEHAAHKLE